MEGNSKGHMALWKHFQSLKQTMSSISLSQMLKECQKEVHGRLVLGDLYTIYNDPSITFCLVRSVATRQVQHLEDIQARDPDSEMRWTG
jgi:hypothetical protein